MSPIEPVWEPAVESLPHPLRMRELASHARNLAGTPQLVELLASLSARGPYERRIALHMAMAARDLPYIERVLAGPDMALRRAALRAVRTLPVSDDAAAAVLDDAPAGLRRAFYKMLRHSRRSALADRLLPDVRARWGDREAAALLPACTGEAVERLLPELEHAVTAWRALAGRHPRPFLARARERGSEWSFWGQCKAGLLALARHDPAGLLELLEEKGAPWAVRRLPREIVPSLFRVDVVRAARVARHLGRRGRFPRAYFENVSGLPLRDLREFLPADPSGLRDFLWYMPPGRRAEVYDDAKERHADRYRGMRAFPLLALLPPDRAAAEARRMLEWHGSVWHSARSRLDDPEIPLKLTAHLPYAEAVGPVRKAAFGGEPRRRGLARVLLIDLTVRTGDPALLRDLVAELVRRTRNERDPHRGLLVAALATVPVGLLHDGLADAFADLAAAVADARDSSEPTRRRLRGLADRVLAHAGSPALTGWALGVYARLVARYGAEALDGHRLDRVLPRGAERGLMEVLRPRLRGHEPVVALAGALGRRAFALPDLQEGLRAAILDAPEDLAREAAGLWLADPAHREDRAVELLAADASAVVLPDVWQIVACRRTDLLLAVLDGGRGGRFETAEWVPEVWPQDAGRWTPAQVERVRALVVSAVGDDRLPVGVRIEAVMSLGLLPGGFADLLPVADQEDGTVLAEAALAAMAVVDRPADALPVLLRHARGDRSPVATAALRSCCASVRPSLLGPVIAEALTGQDGKVTTRKQAARLLERLRLPDAADVLLRAWNDPDLHQDVRVAVASALRRMPGDPRAIPALDDAAGPYASELMLRTLFQAKPSEYAPAHRPAYAALVRRLGRAADGPGVRFRASKAFGAWAPWYADGLDDIFAAVADPDDPAGDDEIPVVRALVRTGTAGEEALDVLGALLASGPGDRARARATSIASTIANLPREHRHAPLAGRVVRMLAEHPLYLAQAVGVALDSAHLTADGVTAERVAEFLAGLADLLRDRPALTGKIVEDRLAYAIGGYSLRRGGGPARLLPAARLLAGREDAAAHLLAARVVGLAGPAALWPLEWRGLLDGLRESPHLEVRQAAWDVIPDH
ncbi:HEAT repeat domain-containing protein [Actinomadura darangshiensis]|uniref:HEAT repeat domain-containing protein n=1 Tax=Actinomadura darangshiensis TaxID=705336 RepID=A0A4R5BP65_9ACTN|nr:HEAT repeat domain-containing protein [Actinomadura darangshiensis]TDD88678.1 HEAT repeat domain-containing protein [Actinomadura darangshiensis]